MLTNLSEGDIRLLRVFAKVVEAGGYSAAQISLNVSQSTISTHMTALEQRLGVRLCERGRSGFSLTERGQLVYAACQRLFLALDEFRVDVGTARNCLTGTLSIGILDSIAGNPACKLPQAIATFNNKAPEVRISMHVASPAEIERAVLDGNCDLGLGACGRHSPYLQYLDLFEERQVLYCGEGHPLFERHLEIGVADLKGHAFARRAYAAPEVIPVGIGVEATAAADLMESVVIFILSGKFMGFLPTHFANLWVSQGSIRPLLDSTLGYQNPLYLTTRRAEERKPVLSAFLLDLLALHGKSEVAIEQPMPLAG